MTFNHKKASEQIARIYGVDSRIINNIDDINHPKYFTQDLGALMELAVKNRIDLVNMGNCCTVYLKDSHYCRANLIAVSYEEHNNDPIEATRVAIAGGLIQLAEEV